MFYSGNFISADSARKKIHGGSGEVGKGDGYKPGGQWSSLHHQQSHFPCFTVTKRIDVSIHPIAAAFLEFHEVSILLTRPPFSIRLNWMPI